MDFLDVRNLLWLASILYLVAFVSGIALAPRADRRALAWAPLALILSGFAIQTRALYLRGLEIHGCPLGNGMERIQFILWSVVLGYLIVRVLFRLNLLGSFAAGLAGLGGTASLMAPSLDSPYWKEPEYERLFSNSWVELHASVAIFSYGLFALLAVVSVMYLIQQNALRAKRRGTLAPFLSSIHQLETASERLLLVGSIFLTASIAVGSLHWMRSLESVSSAKLGVTMALWIAYCALWYLHFRQKLFGKKFAKACIALFVVAILSLGLVGSAAERSPSVPDSSPSPDENAS
ncbi:MAG: cytochrome c biogenesis protein CcsA [Opitutales bacterium]